MAEYTLVAESGRTTGSAASRRLRASGRIPAVVYGHGLEARSVSVDARELRHALSGEAGLNQLLSLKIGSDTELAVARSLQRHPVRHTVVHIDFQVVRRDEVILADVPIVLVGEAKAVEQEKGIIEQQLTALTVRATPGLIPGHIEVDISGLTVGEGIRVGDISLPRGVSTDVGPDEVVAMGIVTRAMEEVAPEGEAEAEGAEAASAAGEGGAEPEGAAGRESEEG
ncbi:MAG TPA: 50S ribosomal protein L25 [Acidimicrobiales bacterium]|nr:50S ribosomal protein L25 [Acidimicrobiales bacterium]